MMVKLIVAAVICYIIVSFIVLVLFAEFFMKIQEKEKDLVKKLRRYKSTQTYQAEKIGRRQKTFVRVKK